MRAHDRAVRLSRTCGAVLEGGKNRGKVCGRPVRGFLVPGMGRCAYHLTDVERARVRSIAEALRDSWNLAGLTRPPEEWVQNAHDFQGDQRTDAPAEFEGGDGFGPGFTELDE